MTDKEFFQEMIHESKRYSESFSEAFPSWMLKTAFINEMTDDDIYKAVEGLSGNDESIDAFYINHDSQEINIFQFKSALNEKNMVPCEKEWLSYLYDVPNKLVNDEYITSHKNQRLKDISYEFNRAFSQDYKIIFHFFHLGYIPNNQILNSYQTENKKFLYYDIRSIRDLYEDYRSKINLSEPEWVDFSIETTDVNNTPIQEKIGKHRTLVLILSSDQLVKMRREYKYQIFEKNVRYNLGSNRINKRIIDSAKSSKHNFYFFNNGITITSNRFKLNGNKIRIEHPQIINGAQTVESIYKAFQDEEEQKKRIYNLKVDDAFEQVIKTYKDLKVLVRIIQIDNEDTEFSENVIWNNNSQNSVKLRDKFSNRDDQKIIQDVFARNGIFYEIKRGEKIFIKKNDHPRLNMKLSQFCRKDENLDIETFVGLYRAYLGEPSFRQKWAFEILDDNEIYTSLFGTKLSDLTERKLSEMVFAYNLYYLLDQEAKLYNKILRITQSVDHSASIDDEKYSNLKDLISSSLVFNQVLKNKFSDIKVFNESQDIVIKQIKNNYPFSQGKYLVLALLKVILEKCNYSETIYKLSLYQNLGFIKDKIIRPLLPKILDKLIVPYYSQIISKDTISINAFYMRETTFRDINLILRELDIKENQEFTELFPIKF